jgi:hypothetical protein
MTFGQTNPVYEWQKSTNSLALIKSIEGKGPQMIWQFNYPEGKRTFFHPVYSPNGTLLTAEAPADHRWHLGLWFCWKYINGLNYWEYSGDPKNEVSEGKTDTKEIKIRTRKDGSALIDMKISYHPWDSAQAIVMEESRTMVMNAPDKEGSWSMDFIQEIQAVKDVLLERTPPQTSPNGVSWGGYAGLSVRFDQSLSHPVYFSQELDSMVSGNRTPWVAANLLNKEGKPVQMVIIEDHTNLRYPTPWYCINRPAEKFWYYNAALLYHEGLALKAGEKFKLRYRILFPSSPLTRDQIEKTIH